MKVNYVVCFLAFLYLLWEGFVDVSARIPEDEARALHVVVLSTVGCICAGLIVVLGKAA